MSLAGQASDSKPPTKEKMTCKGCKWTGTSLRKHLIRTKSPCKELYDMEALKKESDEQNKSKNAKREYERYHSSTEESQRKKAAVHSYRQEHHDEISLAKKEYYKKKLTQKQVENHSQENPSPKLAQEMIEETEMNIEKEENDNKCSICDKTFVLPRVKESHMEHVHSTEPNKFSCDICEKAFSYKDNLTRHMKEVHGGEKHKCEVCPAAYNRLSDLDQHINSGWHYLEYNCDLCDETLVCKSMRTLIEHVIVKQPETEEEAKSFTFKMRWTGIFVTCKSNKKGLTVDGEKGSLSSNSRKCDKVWAHNKRMKHKEKIINDGLSRANTKAKVKLELTKQEHEETDGTCIWCNVPKPKDKFCNSRYSLGNWVLERLSK